MKKIFLIYILVSIIPVYSQTINKVVAVIGNKPVTNYDLDKQVNLFREKLKKNKKIKINKKLEHAALDNLIEKEIINYLGEKESIRIGSEKIDEVIKNQMEAQGIQNESDLDNILKKTEGVSLTEYKKELAFELKKQKIIQIKLHVTLPTSQQIQDWYTKNKKSIGEKVLLRVITKEYKKGDVKDELRANKEINKARKEALKDFDKTAKKYSDHPSKNNGGLLNWIALGDIARSDRVLAGAANNTKKGQVSQVFVGSSGYYIIKIEDKKDISLEEAYDLIRSVLYQENMLKDYEKWIIQQRKNIAVKIFLDDYRE